MVLSEKFGRTKIFLATCHQVVTLTKIGGIIVFRGAVGMSSVELAMMGPNCICFGRILKGIVVLTVLDFAAVIGAELALDIRSELGEGEQSTAFFRIFVSPASLAFLTKSWGEESEDEEELPPVEFLDRRCFSYF